MAEAPPPRPLAGPPADEPGAPRVAPRAGAPPITGTACREPSVPEPLLSRPVSHLADHLTNEYKTLASYDLSVTPTLCFLLLIALLEAAPERRA